MCLHETSAASDVEGIVVGSKTDVGLLGAVGADKSVDLEDVSTVELLDSGLDLVLVGPHVDVEDKGVSVVDLLGSNLGVDVGNDDLVLVEAGVVSHGLVGVSGLTGQSEGLGAVERSSSVELVLLLTVHALSGSLLSGKSLLLFTSSHFQICTKFELD